MKKDIFTQKEKINDSSLIKEKELEIKNLKEEIKRLRKALNDLTPPLDVLLKRRGFRIYKKEPSDDLLIPEQRYIDKYYEMLNKYSFRIFLRDIIKHQPIFKVYEVTRYSTKEVINRYIDFMIGVGLVEPVNDSYRLKKAPIKSFGETLEWFVAEIFRREFLSEAIWGAKIKRPGIGGDYDLLAKINSSILYMEIKSSPPKQIYQNEISAFFDRVFDLVPEIAIFFLDTELRMKDKIVPMFEQEFNNRMVLPPDIKRMEKELFEISIVKPKIFIMNSKDSISNNIEKILSWYFRGSI
jgi:hypothetical protein